MANLLETATSPTTLGQKLGLRAESFLSLKATGGMRICMVRLVTIF